MWNSTGRSGYGESTIQGNYDSWDGLSRNGRQYKNEATTETRDLSGADYWHLRKQNRPTEEIPAHLHMLKNGKANIDAYAEVEKPKKKPSITIQDRILPQARRVQRLTEQLKELVDVYKAGNMDIEEYSILLSVISAKRSRAEKLLAKAKSVRAPFEMEDEEPISLGKTHVKSEKSFKTSKGIATEGNRFKDVKKPTSSDNRFTLSKVADWINNHQFTYFVVCSTIALTAAKLIF